MTMRILLADDSPFWRDELRAILEDGSGWTVFQATNGAEAVQKSTWVRPDAVVLDACMPVQDGLSAAREFSRRWPAIPVVMVTVDNTPLLEARAREAGVLAVFTKMECLQVRNFLTRMFLAKAA